MDSQEATVNQDLVAQLEIPDNLVHLEHQALDLWALPDQKDLQALLVLRVVVAVSIHSHLFKLSIGLMLMQLLYFIF